MIDFENRIYYKQIDVSTFIQLKRVFDRDILIYKPAEQDIMYGAVLTLQNIDKQ
jgi:oligoribonuclease (3'-5' exoribonuclease)